MKWRICFVLIIFCFVIACKKGSTDSELETFTVNYNGLYRAPNSSYSYYLRFYSDGTVLSVTSAGTPEQVAVWFGISQYSGKGTYTINGNAISFSTTSISGRVDYSGTVQNDGDLLLLDSYSHINGNQSTRSYTFISAEFS